MAKLTVRDLHTTFGSVKAVDGVSLDVRDGEFLVLLGASGSGKTTLMRTIAGLEKSSSGEVMIGDRVVNGLPPNDRNIGMVFQSYALYPHKTVARNISFPLEAVRTDKVKTKERVEWAANLFGIGHLLDRKPRMLSGGERQRVALARALVREPNLFLLDEPLSNLDAKLRHQARHELKKLHHRIGITTIYVTHDQVEAMGLGERVAVMNFGKIEQIGQPSDIYREPANTFVARFMGSPAMNLINHGGETLGFHPENLLPVGEFQPDPDSLRLRFLVSGLEDLGADLLLYGSIPGSDTSPMGEGVDVIAKLPARLVTSIEVDKEADFFVRERYVNRFDPVTGQRSASVAA